MPGAVLTITVNPALDVSATVEYLVPDHKMPAIDHRRDAGGGGVNVARVLRRLDVGSRAWVRVGGAVGDELMSLVESEGVEVIALAVSLGRDGAVLVEHDGPITWFDPIPVDAASTVGAGDAMVAGIVAGLAAGSSLVDATARGVAAGTATVLTPGTDLCHAEDVARLFEQVRTRPNPA